MSEDTSGTPATKTTAMPFLLGMVGIASLVSGIINARTMQIFWGVIIIGGSTALHFVRKKDWKAHWEEQDRYRQACLDHEAKLKEQQGKEKDVSN